MALEVRRIVTGHDANGKAVVTTDERLAAVPRLGRPHIAGYEIWSTEAMPVDNTSEAAEAAQRLLCQTVQLCRLRSGHGDPHYRIRARRAQIHASHRNARLRAVI